MYPLTLVMYQKALNTNFDAANIGLNMTFSGDSFFMGRYPLTVNFSLLDD